MRREKKKMEKANKEILEIYRIDMEKDREKFLRKSQELDNYLLGIEQSRQKGLRSFLTKFFGIGLQKPYYQAKIHREVNEALRKRKEERAMKERLFQERIAEDYPKDYIKDFFNNVGLPNRYEFYKIKDIIRDISPSSEKITAIRDLIRKLTPQGEYEFKYLKALRTAFEEDRRKGYLAYCIDYLGLNEEDLLGLVNDLNNCIKRYVPDRVVAAF